MDCSGGLAVTFLEEAQRLLSRFVCVYFGCISQGAAGVALVGWWWHHSRRRGDCSHVLIACIQATSLKGAQGVLWWVAMSLRARCFFSTHVTPRGVSGMNMNSFMLYAIGSDLAVL